VDDNEKVSAPQKITILLAEYNTLRTEVITARIEVTKAIGLIFGVLAGSSIFSGRLVGSPWLSFLGIVLAVGYLGVAILWTSKNTESFTARLRELEEEINRRAGERLLVWETDYGWGSVIWRTNKNFKGYTYRPNAPC
jgi:hypothetical protein